MIPPIVLDPLPIVPKIYSSPKRKHLISYHPIRFYNTISYHIMLYHLISYHLTSYQESIYSSPTRRHLLLPYSLLQQEDMFFSHKKTYHVSRPYIQAPNTSSRVHTHHLGSGPQKFEILTFSQIHPMTFGLCLGIITDTFQRVFKF